MSNHSQFPTIVAILIGGVIIAGTVLFSDTNPLFSFFKASDEVSIMRDSDRHIYGDKNAPITIVEFSDFECPYCSKAHPIIKRIVDEYPNEVQWEYRHLPLSIHKNAVPAAVASECVHELAGNESFWTYTDTLFANQRSLQSPFLVQQAVALGVDEAKFTACLNDPKIAAKVELDANSAVAFGGSGTPFSIIVFADGTTKPVTGALPYEQWMSILSF